MLPQNNPDRIGVVFARPPGVGQCRPAHCRPPLHSTWACGNSSTMHLDLGPAHRGDGEHGGQTLTLVASVAGGQSDFIDDADALRAGGTVGVLGCVVKAPSTLHLPSAAYTGPEGSMSVNSTRSSTASCWHAHGRWGRDPIDLPLTIDLGPTICGDEAYGTGQRRPTRHHNYTGARRGYTHC